MSRTRRIATAAAYSGGGLGAAGLVLGGSFLGLIVGETKLARRRIPKALGAAPVTHGTTWTAIGVPAGRPVIRVAMIGDSLAAGYGVKNDHETPAAQLALSISAAARRPVHVTNVAVVGAESRLLDAQLQTLGANPIDVAVIIVGANDVTHRIKRAESTRLLEAAVQSLTDRGIAVVVGTCPDLGAIRPLAQPLRTYARRLSRQLARGQAAVAVRAGARTVSLGDLLGPLFSTTPGMFGDDEFHPSATGYAAAAAAVLPACLDALGLATRARSASRNCRPGRNCGPGHGHRSDNTVLLVPEQPIAGQSVESNS